MLVVLQAMSRRGGVVVDDDVLYRFRLRLFSLAEELHNVRAACRIFGVHPSTYYRWRPAVLASGLEMLRPRERRPPRMPNQLSPVIEERIVAFSLGHPGLGPRRGGARLAPRPPPLAPRPGRAAHHPPAPRGRQRRRAARGGGRPPWLPVAGAGRASPPTTAPSSGAASSGRRSESPAPASALSIPAGRPPTA